jgi:hypothetical protein
MKITMKLTGKETLIRSNAILVAAAAIAWGVVWLYEARGVESTASTNGHQPVLEFYSPISLQTLDQADDALWLSGIIDSGDGAVPNERDEPSDPPLTDALVEGFGLDEKKASDFAEWIEEASEVSGVPVDHLSALIATESSFRYRAESWAGAVGPAQVMPKFWSGFCGGDLYDPRENIICGARVLAHYRESCPDEDWACAFKKYNVGPSAYRKASSAGAMNRYITKIRHNHMLLADSGASAP